MSLGVKLIKDSINPDDVRLSSFEVEIPKFMVAEWNTHRDLSRNSASSRAIPTRIMMKAVLDNPFIPEYFGLNKKGMQASEEIDESDVQIARGFWKNAADFSVDIAKGIGDLKVHKQTVNRLLEPFFKTTVVISATNWENFLYQRDSDLAQPEFQEVAHNILELLNENQPDSLDYGSWHLPYITDEEASAGEYYGYTLLAKASSARCARVTHMKQNEFKSLEDEADFCDERLIQPGHWSPLEHSAMSVNPKCADACGNFAPGWKQLRKFFNNENAKDSRLIKKYYQGLK